MIRRPYNLVAMIPGALGYGRTAIRGIADYCRHEPELRLTYVNTSYTSPPIASFKPDGMIVFLRDGLEKELADVGVPWLNISSGMPTIRSASVVPDNHAIGALAAEHFLEAGFQHFAYVQLPIHAFSTERCRGFVERLAQAGHDAIPLAKPRQHASREELLATFGEGLRDLPKPCGVFCCNDQRASRLLEAAKVQGIRVPEEVALIGVDNDEIFCETLDPTLSSIDVDADRIGYTAAEMMHAILKGVPVPGAPVRVSSARLIERQSTTLAASDDPDVRRAIVYIRHHLSERIDVSDVVDACATSRRTLERRFHAALGRSPADEIERQRLARARQLLIDTDRPLSAIASECGFKYQRHLSMLFGRKTGMTPSAFRAQHRKR